MLNRMIHTTRFGVFVLLLLAAVPAYALRCDRHVISEGEHKIQVLRHCGEPVSVQEWQEAPRQQVYDFDLGHYVYQPFGKQVHMAEWIYNFGPRRLMRKLTFRDGELIKIETLSYGY